MFWVFVSVSVFSSIVFMASVRAILSLRVVMHRFKKQRDFSFPKRYASPRALYMFSGMLSEVPGPASAEIGIATPDLKKSLSEQYV